MMFASRSVPLLRPVKMERKGLEESFVTLPVSFLKRIMKKIHTL